MVRSIEELSCKALVRKSLSLFVMAAFILTSLVPPTYAQAVFNLPQPGEMIGLSGVYTPVVLKGVSIHPEDPLLFDFIVDNGNSDLKGQALTDETTKLVKYFLTGLAVPEKELWVNLSPVENNRIMADDLSHTDAGRDMLAQDYILKQITSTLMYPEKDLGRKFWDEIYSRVNAKFGTTDIPVDTFNKVWITPDVAEVYQHDGNAFVTKAHLKVMLEADYNALNGAAAPMADAGNSQTIDLARDVVREVILPVLEKEVNEGKNFAALRQVFNSLILAGWYKHALKDSLLNQVYAGTNKVAGIDIAEKNAREQVYAQYLQAYQKGVYNYIKEEFDSTTKESLPRKYFSGGAVLDRAMNPDIKNKIELGFDFFRKLGKALTVVPFQLVLKQAQNAVERTKNNIAGNKTSKYFDLPELSSDENKDLISAMNSPLGMSRFLNFDGVTSAWVMPTVLGILGIVAETAVVTLGQIPMDYKLVVKSVLPLYSGSALYTALYAYYRSAALNVVQDDERSRLEKLRAVIFLRKIKAREALWDVSNRAKSVVTKVAGWLAMDDRTLREMIQTGVSSFGVLNYSRMTNQERDALAGQLAANNNFEALAFLAIDPPTRTQALAFFHGWSNSKEDVLAIGKNSIFSIAEFSGGQKEQLFTTFRAVVNADYAQGDTLQKMYSKNLDHVRSVQMLIDNFKKKDWVRIELNALRDAIRDQIGFEGSSGNLSGNPELTAMILELQKLVDDKEFELSTGVQEDGAQESRKPASLEEVRLDKIFSKYSLSAAAFWDAYFYYVEKVIYQETKNQSFDRVTKFKSVGLRLLTPIIEKVAGIDSGVSIKKPGEIQSFLDEKIKEFNKDRSQTTDFAASPITLLFTALSAAEQREAAFIIDNVKHGLFGDAMAAVVSSDSRFSPAIKQLALWLLIQRSWKDPYSDLATDLIKQEIRYTMPELRAVNKDDFSPKDWNVMLTNKWIDELGVIQDEFKKITDYSKVHLDGVEDVDVQNICQTLNDEIVAPMYDTDLVVAHKELHFKKEDRKKWEDVVFLNETSLFKRYIELSGSQEEFMAFVDRFNVKNFSKKRLARLLNEINAQVNSNQYDEEKKIFLTGWRGLIEQFIESKPVNEVSAQVKITERDDFVPPYRRRIDELMRESFPSGQDVKTDSGEPLYRRQINKLMQKKNLPGSDSAGTVGTSQKDIQGGIDLGQGDYLKVIGTDASGMPKFDPAQLIQLQKDLRGIVPVPVGVPQPVNLKPLLGLDPNSGNENLQTGQLDPVKVEAEEGVPS